MKEFLKLLYHRFYHKWNYDIQKNLLLNGKILSQLNSSKNNIASLDEVEFQVFSQRGEDGVIQYILSKIEVPNKIFIEFGVENYTESNTRLLLMNNWSGMVMDGSEKNINYIKKDFIYWKYDLVAIKSFITKENINQLISSYTNVKDIGLLSVDIDGNDYWVWEAINVINPRIVICEYNSLFGKFAKVSVPYKPNFVRSNQHYSNLYFGASLSAFCYLAERKGYDFIGTTSAGVNAYFVRKDLSDPFKKYSAEDGFNQSANRDSKGTRGELTFLRHSERLHIINELLVVNVETGQEFFIRELEERLN
jgi:hypothetical protein